MGKETKVLKNFVHFLKENNAYEEFMINFHKRNMKYFPTKRDGKKFMKIYTRNYAVAKEIINFAFVWHDTPQGHGYWSDLNTIWKRICAKK